MKKMISILSMMVVCGVLSQKSVYAGIEGFLYAGGACFGNTGDAGNEICSGQIKQNSMRTLPCAESEVGSSCNNSESGGTNHKCIKLAAGPKCAARSCPSDTAMVIHFPKGYFEKDPNTQQYKTYTEDDLKGKAVALNGICTPKSDLAQDCNDKCDESCTNRSGQCEPWYVDWQVANNMLKNKNYIPNSKGGPFLMTDGQGYVSCHCVVKENVREVEPENKCRDVVYVCPNVRGTSEDLDVKFEAVLDGVVEKGTKKSSDTCINQTKKWLKDNAATVVEKCNEKLSCTNISEDFIKQTVDEATNSNGKLEYSVTISKEELDKWGCQAGENGGNVQKDGSQEANSSETGAPALEASEDEEDDSDSTSQEEAVPAPEALDEDEVKGARDRINAFMKMVDSDRSVWKNTDGSFNATRLASDLTAGVVLGTVGGVVSGVLIKKSQVDKGFDALNCSVGGQKIADWGDEFRVGLRR